MIGEADFYFGAAIGAVVDLVPDGVCIQRLSGLGAGFYVIANNLGILVKYSTSRLSPWSFTFTPKHVSGMLSLEARHKTAAVFLQCGYDGMIAITSNDIWQLIGVPQTLTTQRSISVARRPGRHYSVRGSDGVLSNKVSRTSLLSIVQLATGK